jgi:hypothetical protein
MSETMETFETFYLTDSETSMQVCLLDYVAAKLECFLNEDEKTQTSQGREVR